VETVGPRETKVSVTNLTPADPKTICTREYRAIVSHIPLGSDFEPGQVYTLLVNDVTHEFKTQAAADSSRGGSLSVRLGQAFSLPFKQTALVESEGLSVEFAEVLEDSRCPANVVCIQAGRARILVDVRQEGESGSSVELFLELPREDRSIQPVGDYLVRLEGLDPHPGTTGAVPGEGRLRYVANLVVMKAKPPAEKDDEATMTLTSQADTRSARTMSFWASIAGGPDNNRALWCHGWTWNFGDGESVSAMPGCVPYSPERKIIRQYSYAHTYKEPGRYEVTFSYGPLTASAVVDVK
jgi:hypothetical protein